MPHAEPVRGALEKILSTQEFARNERLSKFLRFVVEQQLMGKAAELKESVVGIEVFGRKPGYDPRQDSVVRTEAAKLRARLTNYYSSEGANDPVVIELPKGGYTPLFRERQEAAPVPPIPRVSLAIALAVLTLVAAAGGWWWARQTTAPISIAVLPFENLSPDPAKDYFADGLTDEIIRNLTIIDGLAVRSRTSSFALKGKPHNVREAGRQLDADYILEGSILSDGQQLRINAQLIRVRDDLSLWSGGFDLESTHIFAIQDEISRGIVNSLRLKLGRGRRRYETSLEAYNFYLHALALQSRRGMQGYRESTGLFEQAIAKDPAFAPAYAGLAEASAFQSGHFHKDPDGETRKMRAAAEKAIQLDPLLAEAYDALGMACARDAQWEQSANNFRHAIELAPNRSETYHHFAEFHAWPLGRIEEALQRLRTAEKTDPLSPEVHFNMAYLLISAGRSDEAAGQCEKLPVDFWATSTCLGRARFWQGRTSEAIQTFEAVVNKGEKENSEAFGFLGYAYARIGRREDAERAAAGTANPFVQSAIFAGLGDRDRTFEALHRAATTGPIRIGWTLAWPELGLLRGDPRLKALRKNVGLPE